MPEPPHSSSYLLVHILPHNIALFRFLLEAYDNIAYFTVIDRHEAILKIIYSPDCAIQLRRILTAMQDQVNFDVQPWPFLA